MRAGPARGRLVAYQGGERRATNSSTKTLCSINSTWSKRDNSGGTTIERAPDDLPTEQTYPVPRRFPDNPHQATPALACCHGGAQGMAGVVAVVVGWG